MRVKDVMNKDVVKVYPQNTIEDALQIFAEHPFSLLPVVNEKGEVVGVLSRTDIMNAILPDFLEDIEHISFIRHFGKLEEELFDLSAIQALLLVKDLMTEKVVSINAEDSLLKAAAVMQKHKVRALPVVEERKLCGIITRTDIIMALYKRGGGR
jgi:CBS domain-containing protein